MYGMIYDSGTIFYPPRVALALRNPGIHQSAINSEVGASTPYGVILTRWTSAFIPGVLELHLYGMISDPGMGPHRSPVALAL